MGVAKVSSGVRSRAWVFTSFNLDDVARLKELSAPVLVVGEEVCPTTGRAHLQGYVRFTSARSLAYWKNQFPSFHVEARRGTEEEAINYCLKDGHTAIDRRDLVSAVKAKQKSGDVQSECIKRLQQGESIRSLWSDHPVYVATRMRMLRNVVRMLELWGHRDDGSSPDNLSGLEL